MNDRDHTPSPLPAAGRFAPSPTGRMHLGNVFTALLSWLSARSAGGRWILRIEDLDPQQSRPEFAGMIEDDLLWLGLPFDEGGLDDRGPSGPYSQSRRGAFYEEALARLSRAGLTYPCRCTRAEILATQAPHQSDGRVVYSGRCRPAGGPPFPPRGGVEEGGRRPATRLYVPDEEIAFTDLVAGPRSFNLARDAGDFILRRGDGAWAYQLAVVVDDAAMGVGEVVRGNDLLLSAAQQIWLYRLLGLREPRFAHVPLVCNASGERLSKRDRGLSMESLRARFTPGELTGLLAFMAGLLPAPEPCRPSDLLEDFRWSRVTRRTSVTVPPSALS